MAEARDDLALLLAWEIGKPWRLACADVDRALDGVRWYVEEIDQMLATDVAGGPYDRTPLPGPVSNIASWNYPMSVLVHAELVQLLAGNAVMAKTPTQGGAITLTLAHALTDGGGPAGDPALRRRWGPCPMRWYDPPSSAPWPSSAAAPTAARSRPSWWTPASGTSWSRRGSTPGVCGSSPTGTPLAAHLHKGFEYAKQRCTAYPRFVVQRELVDDFLAIYLPVVASSGSGTRSPSRTTTTRSPSWTSGR